MSCIPQGVKLFIGQIPKDYGEIEVRSLFEPYGEIYSLDLLVHGAEGQHRGCAFLTYYSNESAKKAQEELHGKVTLPGARNPMQVKPAFSEVSPENRKLFCGMLSKSLSETDIRDMFSQFGTIEKVSVVRSNGESKGCAFVLFETRQQAMNAIKAMHHSQTMDGCMSPMVVKLADSEKDKMAKNIMKQSSLASTNNTGVAASPQSATVAGPIAQLQQQAIYYQQLFNQLVIPQIMAGNLPAPGAPGAVTALINAMAVQAKTLDAQALVGGGAISGAAGPSSLPQTSTPYSNSQMSIPYGMQQSSGPIDVKQAEGPEGANLFIYQIPTEYTDSDLMQLFTPFGKVLSAKVFFDKATQLSKGFGFVSFQEPSSAANAITSMNNFVLGDKRLRVSLKKKKGAKPY